MKWSDYFGAKAAELCFYAIAIIVWGVFAFLTGANPALLWGSIGFFVSAIAVRLGIGFASARNRIAKLEKLKNGLDEKYLIGELIPKPHDAVQKEYYEIMKEISRSAIGAAESAKREKDEYYDYVEKWIHEIKTPLTACSLICDNGGNIEKLRRELKKADNLTDTILQYARLRTPQNDTKISKLRVSDAIEEAVQSQRELLIASKISVSVNGDFCIYTDGKAVCFMLKQLLINCAKYCAGCRISITAENGVVTVADNGPGIPSHELPRIFDRGFTGAHGKSAGTGMGLFIVSEICKRLSVKLDATSRPGDGTAFSFEFPRFEN